MGRSSVPSPTRPVGFHVLPLRHGGELLNTDNTVAINNEAGVQALTFYANLLKDGLVPPDVSTYGYVEILKSLSNGTGIW